MPRGRRRARKAGDKPRGLARTKRNHRRHEGPMVQFALAVVAKRRANLRHRRFMVTLFTSLPVTTSVGLAALNFFVILVVDDLQAARVGLEPEHGIERSRLRPRGRDLLAIANPVQKTKARMAASPIQPAAWRRRRGHGERGLGACPAARPRRRRSRKPAGWASLRSCLAVARVRRTTGSGSPPARARAGARHGRIWRSARCGRRAGISPHRPGSGLRIAGQVRIIPGADRSHERK